MMSARLVPVLLIEGRALVKTRRFHQPVYLGDPVNTVRIFNDKAVDELTILDISATPRGQGPDFEQVAAIAEEAFMPIAYGGGITTLAQATELLRCGVDKVVLNSVLFHNIGLIREIADRFGAQAVCASVDVGRTWRGAPVVVSHRGRKRHALAPDAWAQRLAAAGAGEIMLQTVDRDGTMQGYDHALVRQVALSVTVPLVACGGAADIDDLVRAVVEDGVSGAGAGAMFVFYGQHRAVLINPPSQDEFQARLQERLRSLGSRDL